MTPDPDVATLIERYDNALQDEIVVDPSKRTSADYLMAAAFAQSSPRNRAAMALYRAKHHVGPVVVSEVKEWSVGELLRQFGRLHPPLRPGSATVVFEIALHWYLEGVCQACMGRRYELVHGTQVVSTHPCRVCDGKGREPVHHRLPRRHHEPGRWLVDQWDDAMSYVEGEMAKWLR